MYVHMLYWTYRLQWRYFKYMHRETLLKLINEKFDEEDIILIEDLEVMFKEEGESARNETLLRVIHGEQIDVNYELPIEKVIRDLAVWTTHQIFRNGTIEDLHAGKYGFADFENIPPNTPIEQISQLTQKDMKNLNKELVDNVGFILKLFSQADYFKLAVFINSYRLDGDDWDNPNIKGVESEYNDYLLMLAGVEKDQDK